MKLCEVRGARAARTAVKRWLIIDMVREEQKGLLSRVGRKV
jgi:hypothetical protein